MGGGGRMGAAEGKSNMVVPAILQFFKHFSHSCKPLVVSPALNLLSGSSSPVLELLFKEKIC